MLNANTRESTNKFARFISMVRHTVGFREDGPLKEQRITPVDDITTRDI